MLKRFIRRKSMLRNFYLIFCLFLSFSIRADLTNNWIVTKVYISDTARTKTVSYDDPIYLNRIFQWDENVIKTNIYSGALIEICSNYKVNKFIIDFDEFLNKEMLSADSFDLNMKQKINQLNIFCPNIQKTWTLFEKNADAYLIVNTNDSILEINRIKYQNTVPSFSCSKAKKVSEKLICQNIYLSGLDRSIHDIYHNIKKYYDYNNAQKEFEEIYSNQKKFIQKRDLCTNEKCLMDIMNKHTYELHQYMPLITPY